nr:MAG TPA: hypothetical protein [Caudoviricetes sp.]
MKLTVTTVWTYLFLAGLMNTFTPKRMKQI